MNTCLHGHPKRFSNDLSFTHSFTHSHTSGWPCKVLSASLGAVQASVLDFHDFHFSRNKNPRCEAACSPPPGLLLTSSCTPPDLLLASSWSPQPADRTGGGPTLLEAESLWFPLPLFCTFNFILVAVLFPSLLFWEGVTQVSLIYYGLFFNIFFYLAVEVFWAFFLLLFCNTYWTWKTSFIFLLANMLQHMQYWIDRRVYFLYSALRNHTTARRTTTETRMPTISCHQSAATMPSKPAVTRKCQCF